MHIELLFFDIGIGYWPYPCTINIGHGLFQIMPLDWMVKMEILVLIIGSAIYILTTLKKEFIKGYKGK
jgi:hypothetical protein